jgi:hypothetical protein
VSHGIDVTVETLIEGTTPEISAVLVDLSQTPISGSVLSGLKLTYYQEYTQAIINSRNAQNVLQTNGVTVDGNGKLVWNMSAADTVILNDALETEPHIAHFEFSYLDGDTKVGSLTVRIPITNILRDAS